MDRISSSQSFEKLDIEWLEKNAQRTPMGNEYYYQYEKQTDSISILKIEGEKL